DLVDLDAAADGERHRDRPDVAGTDGRHRIRNAAAPRARSRRRLVRRPLAAGGQQHRQQTANSREPRRHDYTDPGVQVSTTVAVSWHLPSETRNPTVNVPGAVQVKVAPVADTFPRVPPVVSQTGATGLGTPSMSCDTAVTWIEAPTWTSDGMADSSSITGQVLSIVPVISTRPWHIIGICRFAFPDGLTLNISCPRQPVMSSVAVPITLMLYPWPCGRS